MDPKYSYVQCRLCLHKSECLSDIFEDNGRQGFTAADIITDLLQFKVYRRDGYSQLVCLDCLDKLIDFRQFKEQCQNAKTKFEKELLSKSVIIDVQRFGKSNMLATDVNIERYVGFNEGIENRNIDTHEEDKIYIGENNASEFCDIVVKKELEESTSDKELSQNNDKTTVEQSIIPCDFEIKEEELIISNASTETTLVATFQFNTTGQREMTIFECSECHEKFLQKRKFNAHMKNHKEEEGFPCEVCGKKFKSIFILIEHKRIHSGEKPYRCKFCGKCFMHHGSYWRHEMMVHVKERKNGNTDTNEENNMYNGENNASENSDNKTVEEAVIPCSVEKKEENAGISNSGTEHASVTSSQFNKTEHRGKTVIECSECHEKFLQKRKFRDHMKGHREEEGFPCEVCGKKFKSNVALIEHKRLHSGEKPYQCKFCGKRFTRHSCYWKHQTRVHEEKQFHCELCPKKFSKNEKLVSHMKIHNRGKPFACNYCKKRFGFAMTLEKHKLLHSGDVPFECNDCGRTFDHKIKLSGHVRYHNKEMLFGCEVCDKRFLQKCGLIEHMMLHNGERPYMCEECGKKFRKKTYLTVHKRVHSGERPFHCDLCDKKFSQKGSLNAHKKLHVS